jgi:YihY family inner membrane protein
MGGIAPRIRALQEHLDRYQQRHSWLGFPIAVIKKFGDDRAGSHAALVAYYGFFSLFPLLLALVTLAGLLLRGNEELRGRVLSSALAQLPLIGSQLQQNIKALSGSWVVVVIGIVGALWAGLGVVRAAQTGMDDVWDVPRRRRPPFLVARLRALIVLVVLGMFVVASATVAAVSASLGSTAVATGVGVGASVLLNVAVCAAAFKLLTVADVGLRDVILGAIVAGVLWTILQAFGGVLIERRVMGASDVYGFFAVVIGLLTWIYVTAQIMFLAAEINAVRARRLWPRVLFPPPENDADMRALTMQTDQEDLRAEPSDIAPPPARGSS